MAGFITLEDGRAYAAANWVHVAVIEKIVDALSDTGKVGARQPLRLCHGRPLQSKKMV
jgi:hypothetical protein